MTYRIMTSLLLVAVASGCVASVEAQTSPAPAPLLGYTDTPLLPGGQWRVHDADRPRPPSVMPGAAPGTPPSDAVILFDGSGLSAWRNVDGTAADWMLSGDGAMEIRSRFPEGNGSIRTAASFGDVQLHIEWRTPAAVRASSQGRANSGVIFLGKYEIQILDSWENPTYADGQASALYGWKPPLVNASRPPGEWQSYDIVFEAPRWDEGGKLQRPATAIIFHNGVLTQLRQPFLGATAHRKVARYEPHPAEGPILLQDHGDPLQFRNIWIRPLAPIAWDGLAAPER
jgi:hypothetical protein